MRPSVRAVAGCTAGLSLVALLVLPGCHDDLATGPDFAPSALRALKVSGGGTGSGTVTAPATGGVPALTCVINAATYDPVECTRNYSRNAVVTLTASPAPGSTLSQWRGACDGVTGPTCTVTMAANRSVRTVFAASGPVTFQVNVAGGGTGDGRVTSQTGVSPAIDCSVTGGVASGACSGSYPSGTSVVLASAPAADHTFNGWSGDCTGTGSCTLAVTANRSVTAVYTAPLGPDAASGRWVSAGSTPVIGVHLNLMPDGRALLWGHGGEPQLWNPSGGFVQVPDRTCEGGASCELFCAGHTFLADGRLLVAGGHNEALGNNNGIVEASIFDGSGWLPVAPMAYKRWYPTLVTLEDGEVVALAGNQAPNTPATIPERWNGSTWTALTGATLAIPMYPRAFVEPRQGHVFVAGEGTTRFLDPFGLGAWRAGPGRSGGGRAYGAAVMLDSKVLYAGGGGGTCPALVQRSAEVIDLAAAAPAWSPTGSMASARRHLNLTILPDGTVLATGGTAACGFTDESGAVFPAELWNPATGAWTTLASANVVRVYHSATALLPDGRVLSTGSGDGGGVTQQLNREVFSPPYLFKGPRPTYDLASPDMHYGATFTVATPDAGSIRKVTLIRLASSTHSFDMGQRLNTLAFQVSADGLHLTLTPPASGRIAPPGPYLLFILNDEGVPSVAQTIMLSR